jgi:hypothetical protein
MISRITTKLSGRWFLPTKTSRPVYHSLPKHTRHSFATLQPPLQLADTRTRRTPFTLRTLKGPGIISRVGFHTSSSRRDVFFVAFPALKATLLNITRITLVFLPFVYRYRLWKRWPKTSIAILQIPVSETNFSPVFAENDTVVMGRMYRRSPRTRPSTRNSKMEAPHDELPGGNTMVCLSNY